MWPFYASAAYNGLNAQHTRYCCPSNSFIKADVSGECIWGCFPASRVSAFIAHYLKAKRRDPSTSGVFVLPYQPKAQWWTQLNSMLQVKTYPKGALIFTASPESTQDVEQPLQPAPWPVVVFWDRPPQTLNPPTKADAALDAGQATVQDGQRRESPSAAIAAQDPGQAVAQDGNPTRAADATAHSDMSRKLVWYMSCSSCPHLN